MFGLFRKRTTEEDCPCCHYRKLQRAQFNQYIESIKKFDSVRINENGGTVGIKNGVETTLILTPMEMVTIDFHGE